MGYGPFTAAFGQTPTWTVRKTMIGWIGFVLLLIGAGSADGNLIIATILLVAGLAMLIAEVKKEGNETIDW